MATEAQQIRLEIIREVAQELGAPITEVTQIVNAQTEYTKYAMEHSGFETIMWPYLGKFLVSPYRLQKLNEPKGNGII